MRQTDPRERLITATDEPVTPKATLPELPTGPLIDPTPRRHPQAWNEEIATHRKAIIRHDEAKRTYIEEAIELVDLAQELPDQLRPASWCTKFIESIASVVAFSFGSWSG